MLHQCCYGSLSLFIAPTSGWINNLFSKNTVYFSSLQPIIWPVVVRSSKSPRQIRFFFFVDEKCSWSTSVSQEGCCDALLCKCVGDTLYWCVWVNDKEKTWWVEVGVCFSYVILSHPLLFMCVSVCVFLPCQLSVHRVFRPKTGQEPVIHMSPSKSGKPRNGPRPSTEISTQSGRKNLPCKLTVFPL